MAVAAAELDLSELETAMMNDTLTFRRWLLVPAVTCVVAGVLALPGSAAAQSGAMQVVVPRLEHQGDAPRNFGRDVAREMRKLINELATHRALDGGDLKDALRQFDVKERDLDCTTARQFALQTGRDMVMCGEVGEAAGGVEVNARFILVDSGDMLEIDRFVQPDEGRAAKAAAQRIFKQFNDYSQMIRSAMIGADYSDSGDWGSALRNYEEALAINGDFTSALYGKGIALTELERLEEAFETLEHLLSIDEDHQDALLAMGRVATMLDRYAVARENLNRYLELNPGNAGVRVNVATDLANQGDPEGALRIAQEGLEQGAEDPALVEYAGHFAIAAAQKLEQETGAAGQQDERPPEVLALYETAADYYLRVFEKKGAETDPNVLQRMILSLIRLERYDEAAQLGEGVVAAVDDRPAIWFTYADALQRAGRTDDALAALDRTQELDPDYRNVDVRRGTWLLQGGKLDEARAAFETAVEKGTATDDIANNIFVFGYNRHYQNDEFDTALDYFSLSREFATRAELDARSAFFSGYIFYQKGQAIEAETAAEAQEALPLYQEALDLFGESEAFTDSQPSIDLAALIETAVSAVDYAEALIEQGR